VVEELKNISRATLKGRAIPVTVLLILTILLSVGSGLYAGASFFAQQAPNVTITTTIFTTTTSWTTSTIWSTVTSVVEGIWTTIQYTTSTSTVTVTGRPPTNLGKTDVGATDNRFSAGDLKAYKYTLSEAGTVQSITVYIQSYGSGAKIRVGIYNDVSSYPGSLVAGNDEWTVGATGWKTITLATPVYLSAGNYWIGLLVEKTPAQIVTFKATTGVGTQRYKATSYGSLPSTFDVGASSSSYSDSVYFTYV
jgi:hypothetical protein